MNGDKTSVDCGGVCDACDLGFGCLVDSDCISDYCFEGFCDDEEIV